MKVCKKQQYFVVVVAVVTAATVATDYAESAIAASNSKRQPVVGKQINNQMDGRTNRQTHGQRDKQSDGQLIINAYNW